MLLRTSLLQRQNIFWIYIFIKYLIISKYVAYKLAVDIIQYFFKIPTTVLLRNMAASYSRDAIESFLQKSICESSFNSIHAKISMVTGIFDDKYIYYHIRTIQTLLFKVHAYEYIAFTRNYIICNCSSCKYSIILM